MNFYERQQYWQGRIEEHNRTCDCELGDECMEWERLISCYNHAEPPDGIDYDDIPNHIARFER